MNRILILGPDPASNQRISQLTTAGGYPATVLGERQSVSREALQQRDIAVIFCDGAWAAELLQQPRHCPFIVLDRTPNVDTAVRLMKAGAADYLAEDRLQKTTLSEILAEHAPLAADASILIIGDSPPMRKLISNITKVAPTDSPVMICGESGTGKELVAHALHAASARRHAPLISVNCATIPSGYIEAELFGHEVNGQIGRRGLLESATGGTLFLDEIGELPKSAQTRLLRQLEGGLDVRLITASHRDLSELVRSEQFRGDLYYRLNVVVLNIPPLRSRGEDILLLAEAALRRTAARLSKPKLSFSAEACRTLGAYQWPGNVRELENAVERAVILSDSDLIHADLLAIEPQHSHPPEPPVAPPDQTIEDYFVNFVTSHQDQMTETELAEKLGISRKSLWERRQRLDIPRKKIPKRGRRRDIS